MGEEEDREIVKLYCELKQFINSYDTIKENNFDIRNIIPNIMKRIYLNSQDIQSLDEEEEDNK